MQKNGTHERSSHRSRRGDSDPWEQIRKVLEEAQDEFEASRERSKRALAEADAALKIGSR